MNKICKWLSEVLFSAMITTMMVLSLISGLPASGVDISQLSTGSSVSSATVINGGVSDETLMVNQRSGAKLAGNNVTIEVINFFGPARNMAGAEAIHRKLIDDYLAGAFNKSSGYVVITDGRIPWTALCYEEGNPTDWGVLQQLIVVKGDSVSISQVSVGQNSTVDVLDDNYVVGSRGYGPAAIGVKSDGSKIESSVGTQTANTILFVTQMKMFNMGATHEGRKTVRTYVLNQKNFNLGVTAKVGSSVSSTASVVVVMPRLFLNTTWDPSFQQVVELSILGDAPDFMYDLYQTSNPNGPWIGMGEVSSVGREIKQESVKFVPYRFFKALPQP